jgi:murein L,D-transpeptidase YcbB/YkuD
MAVKLLQTKHGLAATGVLGRETWVAINSLAAAT